MDDNISVEPCSVSAGRGVTWLVDGFSFFSRDWLAWIGLAILMILLTTVSSAIPVINILVPVITPIFVGGLMLACKQQDDGGEITIAAAFSGFSNNAIQLALIGLAYLLSTIAIFIIMIILVIIIVGDIAAFSELSAENPDIILKHAINLLLAALIGLSLYLPVVMALWFSPALVVFNKLSAIQAMIASMKGCVLNVLPFLLYGILAMLFMILATLPVFLGWLVLIPVMTASVYLSYRDIYQSENENISSA